MSWPGHQPKPTLSAPFVEPAGVPNFLRVVPQGSDGLSNDTDTGKDQSDWWNWIAGGFTGRGDDWCANVSIYGYKLDYCHGDPAAAVGGKLAPYLTVGIVVALGALVFIAIRK